MAVAHTTALNLMGKYVSFSSEQSLDHHGVVTSVVFDIDGSVQFLIGFDDYYNYSDVVNLKILGEVILF
jgi:hypothetical protein